MKTNLTSLFKEMLACSNKYLVDHFFKQKVYLLLDNEKWQIKVVINVKIKMDRLKDVIIGQLILLELELTKEICAPSFYSLTLVELRGKLLEIRLQAN